jgi:hypothetical protein
MADLLKTRVGTSNVAPSASLAKTSNIDAPANTKHAAWSGDRGTYGPDVAGMGLTAAPTPTYYAY